MDHLTFVHFVHLWHRDNTAITDLLSIKMDTHLFMFSPQDHLRCGWSFPILFGSSYSSDTALSTPVLPFYKSQIHLTIQAIKRWAILHLKFSISLKRLYSHSFLTDLPPATKGGSGRAFESNVRVLFDCFVKPCYSLHLQGDGVAI